MHRTVGERTRQSQQRYLTNSCRSVILYIRKTRGTLAVMSGVPAPVGAAAAAAIALVVGVLGCLAGRAQCVPSLEKIPIYIGGFFPLFNDSAYDLLPSTVETALGHVNNMTGLLDGYEMRLRWEWTDGGPANALLLLNKFVYTSPSILMTWGPVLSSEAITLNEVGAMYNLVQVGLANSPSLGQSKYPLTFRVWEEENEVNPARVGLMKMMAWKRCGLIFSEGSFREHFEDLAELLRSSGMAVVVMAAVHDAKKALEQIKILQQHDARIIFTGFYLDDAKHLFCQIYNYGLGGPKYVWIVPGWYPNRWWVSVTRDVYGCSAAELEILLCYHIFVSGVQVIDNIDNIDYHGLRPQDDPDRRAYLTWLQSQSRIDNNWATLGYAYDALFIIALTLNASIADLGEMSPPRQLQEFSYDDVEMAEVFLRNAANTDVHGVTDHVVIGGDRTREFTEYVYIEQSQVNGSYVKVAVFHKANTSTTLVGAEGFLWSDKDPPVDGKTKIVDFITVSLANRLVCYILAAVGTVLALYFLVINIRHRANRAIKLSSPMLNNLIVAGCVCLYGSVFIFGYDKSAVDDSQFVALCFTETTFLCIGTTLTFGALLLKTYRIHLIWANSMRHAKRIELPDSKLMAGVTGLVLIDVVIIVLWIILENTTVTSISFDPVLDETNPTLEIYKVPTFKTCVSDHQAIFTASVYAVKSVLMIAGIFLAWEMRGITVAELNDSRFIALSVYVCALTVVVTVPVMYVLHENQEVYFGVRSAAIIVANTIVLCLVFVPKLVLFYKTKGGEFKLQFGKEQAGGTRATSSTLNMGPGKGAGLMATLIKKHRTLLTLQTELAQLVSHLNRPVSVPILGQSNSNKIPEIHCPY